MVGAAGSVWVEGTALHYISEYGVERSATGSDYGLVDGQIGSFWIEDSWLAYIDTSQHKRLLDMGTIGTVAGANGSTWVEGEWVHYITGTTERYWHSDVYSDTVHSDWSDTASPHSDIAHSNWSNVTDTAAELSYSGAPPLQMSSDSSWSTNSNIYIKAKELVMPYDAVGPVYISYEHKQYLGGGTSYESYIDVNGYLVGSIKFATTTSYVEVSEISDRTWTEGDVISIYAKTLNTTDYIINIQNFRCKWRVLNEYVDWSDHSDTAYSNWSDSPSAHSDVGYTDSYADEPS